MGKKARTNDAVSILHQRYVKDDPGRKELLDHERSNAEIARLVYDLRIQAGLSQRELLVRTTQSVISSLEDADYDGHSLSMLRRIAAATKQKIAVVSIADDSRRDIDKVIWRVLRDAGE